MLTPRQELLLRRVVEEHLAAGSPVGSKVLAAGLDWGPSTIRGELASLEDLGLLTHPHTSAGRVPTDAGYRFVVDKLLPETREPVATPGLELTLVRREVDEAMRVTTETLSQVTRLLAIVSAPPIHTASIRHVEVLVLQPQVLMVVVITLDRRRHEELFTFEAPVVPRPRRLGRRVPEREPRRDRARLEHAADAARRPVARRHRARVPPDARTRCHRARRDEREHALRRRDGAPARRVAVSRSLLPPERDRRHAGAPPVAARGPAPRARRA